MTTPKKIIGRKKSVSEKNIPKIVEEDEQEGIHSTRSSLMQSVRSSCVFDMNERGVCLNECDSEPDRSNPTWKIKSHEKSIVDDQNENQGIVMGDNNPSIWEEIMTEYEDERYKFDVMQRLESPYEPPIPVGPKLSAVQYLEKHIFPILCPILEETLLKAREWDCLMIQKCRFNGLDYISELLWNRNPLHPRRHLKHRDIFDIPFAIIWLYYNPRPIYPLSWLWTKEEAITVMQSYIRRYFVCKEPDCAEMRSFWKELKREREEKKRQDLERYINELDELFNELLDKMVANAVFNVEWRKYGCKCIKTPCHCVCKCLKWCKCCTCYKIPKHDPSPCDCAKKNR